MNTARNKSFPKLKLHTSQNLSCPIQSSEAITTKVISYSLWGDSACYLYGALENALIAQKVFPTWTLWFFVDNNTFFSFYKDVFHYIIELNNTEIIIMNDLNNTNGMLWRFIPAFCCSNVDIVIVRDVDSRLIQRDKIAVNRWIKTKKKFHIIRDFWMHDRRIGGGIWGARDQILLPLKSKFFNFYYGARKAYEIDQEFMGRHIYEYVNNISLIHDEKHHFKHEKIEKIHYHWNPYVGQTVCDDFKNIYDKYQLNFTVLERHSSYDDTRVPGW